MKTEVDFGCAVRGSESVALYRGMNPAFVQRVWAKRRRAAAKPHMLKVVKSAKLEAKEPEMKIVVPAVYEMAERALAIGFESVKQAREIVADLYGISVDELNAKTRRHQIFKARHAAICAIKLRWPDVSLPFIAQFFDIDHTTVLHALRQHGIDTANTAVAA